MTKPTSDEFKSLDFALDIKAVGETDRTFSGYASVFGVLDRGNDIVARGAFSESLGIWAGKGKLPTMFWNHDQREPIGKWTVVREDNLGLYVEGRLTKSVQRADEAYALIKDGAVDGISIGYKAVDFSRDEGGARVLTNLELWEISIAPLPMLSGAVILNVKTFNPRTLEREFRAAGISQGDAVKAVAVAKRYLKRDVDGSSAQDRDETGAELSELLESLRSARSGLT